MIGRRMGSEQSSTILQAVLDLFTYPVWITDIDGNVMLNQSARDLASQGFAIPNAKAQKEPVSITHRGKKFSVRKRDMNHGTNCYLHELREEDESVARMRESAARLDDVLGRIKV